MTIHLHPYKLEFLFPFKIAHGIRTHTDALFVELEQDGQHAFGEATFPPYLPYTQKDSLELLSKIDLTAVDPTEDVAQTMVTLKAKYPALNPPACAALDMALWFLKAKLNKTTVRILLEISETNQPPRSYTIGVCTKDEIASRLDHGLSNGFTFFKLKLDGKNDREMIENFRSLSDLPFAVDANQAWTDIQYAKATAKILEQNGCILIEQPFNKTDKINTKQLADSISIPLIADEACQTITDIDHLAVGFSGINVKLQKCGGITPALDMIRYAQTKNLKVLIGCMSESIIGCSAGEALAPLCDWNDLDGPYLIKDVPFRN